MPVKTWTPHTDATIDLVAKRMLTASQRLGVIAVRLREFECEELLIANQKQLMTALEWLENWTNQAEFESNRWLESDGKFGQIKGQSSLQKKAGNSPTAEGPAARQRKSGSDNRKTSEKMASDE